MSNPTIAEVSDADRGSGTIFGREKFLAHLEQRGNFAPRYEPYQPISDLPEQRLASKSLSELLEIAAAQAEVVNAKLQSTTRMELGDDIGNIITNAGGGQVLIPTDHRFEEFGLRITGDPLVEWQPGQEYRETNIAAAQRANVVVAFADWFLAESCTSVVYTRPGQGRALHFLPTNYISIVPASVVLPRSTQVAAIIDANDIGAQGRAIQFISGPSNSADIELELVIGLHGPLAITYLIVSDA